MYRFMSNLGLAFLLGGFISLASHIFALDPSMLNTFVLPCLSMVLGGELLSYSLNMSLRRRPGIVVDYLSEPDLDDSLLWYMVVEDEQGSLREIPLPLDVHYDYPLGILYPVR